MFVATAASYVTAEPDEGKNWTGDGHYKYANDMHKGHMAIIIEGFRGSIEVPDMSEIEDKRGSYETLKEQVTVNFSEAAFAAENAGLDVTKGELGKIVNENGEKFVVWKLIEKNKGLGTITKTIFVIDAADITNTATITKEYDPSVRYERHYDKDHANTLSDPEKIESKIAMIEQKINGGTLSPEQIENKVQYVFLLRQLQNAIVNDDDVQTDSIREQLQELCNQMIDLKEIK